MSFILGVLAQVVSFVVCFLIFVSIARRNEALIHGIGVFASYRCFKTRSEQAVEKELSQRQRNLSGGFTWRDTCRKEMASSLAFHEKYGFYEERITVDRKFLEEAEDRVVERQRAMDYAIAIAYLSGFGKVARKFVK